MPISSTTNRESYNGDGTTIVFPVPFAYFDQDHVRVILVAADGTETVWTRGSEYTLSGDGVTITGQVTATTAPVTGERVVVRLVVPLTQLTDLPDADYLSDIERIGDIAAQRDLTQQDEIDRSIKFREGSTATIPTVPDPEEGRILGWSAGNLANFAAADLGSTPVSSYVATLLDDADAAAARTTLGAQEADADTAKTDVDQAWSGSQRSPYVNNGASLTFDMNTGQKFNAAPPAGTHSLTFTNLADGQDGRLRIDNTAGATINFGPECEFAGGTPPSIGQGLAVLSYDTDGTKVTITVLDGVASS